MFKNLSTKAKVIIAIVVVIIVVIIILLLTGKGKSAAAAAVDAVTGGGYKIPPELKAAIAEMKKEYGNWNGYDNRPQEVWDALGGTMQQLYGDGGYDAHHRAFLAFLKGVNVNFKPDNIGRLKNDAAEYINSGSARDVDTVAKGSFL